jgi:signal transduction histidine kinase
MGLGLLQKTRSFRADLWGLSIILFVIAGISLSAMHSYLLFHSLAEGFSIVVMTSIFVIAWNSRQFVENDFFLFIGIGLLFVSVVDALHAFAYKGLTIFSDANLATQLWLVTRYLLAATFLAAPLFLRRRVKVAAVLGAYAVVTALLMLSVFVWRIFPVAYIEGQGLTWFKIISEYLLSALFLCSAVIIIRKRQEFSPRVWMLLVASMGAMVISEILFTDYVGVYAFMNFFGHIVVIVAFYLLYKGIVETSLRTPYDTLFRNLRKSEIALKRLNAELEERVEERTLELRRAQEELVRRERLASLGKLAGTVSHDLRNPLGNINNSVYYLKMKCGGKPLDNALDKEVLQQLDLMEREVQRCSALVNELLEFSRVRELKRTETDLNVILQDALAATGRPGNVEVQVRLIDLPGINADPDQLRRAFINIITNAYQAMPKGGSLVIASRVQDGAYEVSFRDTGEGMTAESMRRLFEPLFTTKKGGVGLGMVIIKEINEKHGGVILVKSKQGAGTTITVRLPLEVTLAEAAHRRR